MLRSITLGELRALLADHSQADDEIKVIFTANYGDRGRTPQALPLKGEVEEVQVCESAYSDSGYAVAGDDDYEDEDYEPFLLIR